MSKESRELPKAEENLSEVLYRDAVSAAETAETAEQYRHVADLFNRIKRYEDAEEQAKRYYSLAKETEKKQRKWQFLISLIVLFALTLAAVGIFIVAPIMKYNSAVKLMKSKDYVGAAAAFSSVAGYKDSRDLALESRYLYATGLLEAGELIDSVREFAGLGGYKESKALVKEYELEAIRAAKKYDVVVFGEYLGNPIEWRVIGRDGDIVTLISDSYISNHEKYNEGGIEVSWENSSVREMLNNKFLSHFRENERARVLETVISNPDNPAYGTDAGADTVDRVFLLSAEEVERYFPTAELRIANYAGNTSWWLRTPGENERRAAYVHTDGNIRFEGTNVDRANIGLRPALRLNVAP